MSLEFYNIYVIGLFLFHLKVEAQHQSESAEAAARTDLLRVHRLLWIHRPQLLHLLQLKHRKSHKNIHGLDTRRIQESDG